MNNIPVEGYNYKGYEIRPAVYNRPVGAPFDVRVVIAKHFNDKVMSATFLSSTTFEDRDEAIRHSYVFGKKIIDGEQEGIVLSF